MNLSQLFGNAEANVTYNALAGVLVILGYAAIKVRWVRLHLTFMLTALVTSAVFLASYLYYHFAVKQGISTKFADAHPDAPSWAAPVYYTLLITHVVLAAVVPPLALYTAYQGLRNRLARHVRIAWWTLPIWLYVSATGVIVYWMLYRSFGS
jgi:uncharacterized membrane protein YozB (DUF420 family)